jgi:anti-sigma B factor antagonist
MDEESGVTGVPRVAARPIVTLPAEIDITNAVHVEGELCASVVPGVAVVIADMTQTKFCDSSGIRCLLRAHDVAAAAGAELRIAIHSDAVLRIFRVVGVDHLLNFFPGVEAALTDASAAYQSPDEGPSSTLAAQAPLYRRLVMRSRR